LVKQHYSRYHSFYPESSSSPCLNQTATSTIKLVSDARQASSQVPQNQSKVVTSL